VCDGGLPLHHEHAGQDRQRHQHVDFVTDAAHVHQHQRGVLFEQGAGDSAYHIRWFMRRNQPQTRPLQHVGAEAGANQPVRFEPAQALPGSVASLNGHAAATPTTSILPSGFDAEAFVRQAKVNFLRLQAANDAGNLDDIREFTSPEMYAEIKLDIDERHGATQRTEVAR